MKPMPDTLAVAIGIPEETRQVFDRAWSWLQFRWSEAQVIFESGGWAMWPIAVIATAVFGMGIHVFLELMARARGGLSERSWRKSLDDPQRRHGTVGRLIEDAIESESVEDCDASFARARADSVVPIARDLAVMKVCVSAAPLVGLLGTVTGMLTTFGALSAGSGGDKTMAMIAAGISEALITTETGLVVALPGLFFQYFLVRRFERYKGVLLHLQTVCSQRIQLRRIGDSRRLSTPISSAGHPEHESRGVKHG